MLPDVIPIVDLRRHAPWKAAGPLAAASGRVVDTRNRPMRDLRISVTDRCNFRCTYCMPKEVFDRDYRFLPHSALLSFEEIARLAKLFVEHGVEKIRLTGGEPLLRKGVERLIEMLAALVLPDGSPLDLTLTTNGSLLARKAQTLKDAGLARVSISLDALDDAIFRRMNDADFGVADVLAGIEAAQRAGLGPTKINMVVQRGVNDCQILPMARRFKGSGAIVRFIEYMDVGATNGWKLDQVVPSAEVVRLIGSESPLAAISPSYSGEVAERWRYQDGSGEIGVISSVTHAFCGACTRARLSTEGRLYTCLFASRGHDLRALLRGQASQSNDFEISNAIAGVWRAREDRYSELRGSEQGPGRIATPKIEMSYIGG